MQLTFVFALLPVVADVVLAAQAGHVHGLQKRIDNKQCRLKTRSSVTNTSVAWTASTSSTTTPDYYTTTSSSSTGSSTTSDETTTTSSSSLTTTSSSSSSSSSTTTSSSTTASTTPATTSSSSSSSSSSTSSSTTTTSSSAPVVTDAAYVNTVLRHHNVHRANHSAVELTWSPSLAESARILAQTCIYGRDYTVNGGGYGQNVGAGFPATYMGTFITEGLYNSEINSYTYYGGEPDPNTQGAWSHFSQIVWRSTSQIGCYTNDCSQTGLSNAPGVPPYFTVCNYAPAGNTLGSFAQNVLRPLGFPSIHGDYECSGPTNCV